MRKIFLLFFVLLVGCGAQNDEEVPIRDVEYKVDIFLNKMNDEKYQDIYENELSKGYREKYSYDEIKSFITFFHSSLGNYKKFKLKSSKLRTSSSNEEAYFVSYDVEFTNKPAVIEFVYIPIGTESCNGLCLIHVTFTM